MPEEVERDDPKHRIDQGARGKRPTLAPRQRVKPHQPEDAHQRRREPDLGWDQFADEGEPEGWDLAATELVNEGNPVMISVPENDRRKDDQRPQPAEIEPGRI